MSQSATELLAAIAAYKKEHGANPSHKAVAALVEQVEAALGKQDTEPDEAEDQTMPGPSDIKALRELAAKHLKPKPAPKKEPAKTPSKSTPAKAKADVEDDEAEAPSWATKDASERFKQRAKDYMSKREGSEA